MECNKDEAFKAKELAEKKFMNNDFVEARRFALKARSLYPELEGIEKMISTIDIHIASGQEPHKILQVSKSADSATLRKRYISLVLKFHPDKNRSVSASRAFQIVYEAYNAMCQQSQQSSQVQNTTDSTMFQQETTKPKPSTTTPGNVFNSSGAKSAPETTRMNQQNGGAPNPAPASVPRGRKQKSGPSPSNSDARIKKTKPTARPKLEPITFWTSCDQCRMMFEYRRTYLNLHLVCRNCRQPYVAKEIKTASME
uniref:J domain-containing protein n=1 Tax=Oryza brachyantha TaxID=4533 RepID=J3ME59_ORYBR